MMVKIYAIEIIFKSHKPFQSYHLTGPANSERPIRWYVTLKWLWDLKMISMAYIFTIIFISKLVSNVCQNFLCIAWHQKPTVFSDHDHENDFFFLVSDGSKWTQ